MMKNINIKYLFLLLAAFIFVSSANLVYGSTLTDNEKAEYLKSLGLFKGTGSGFELERRPTRVEAAVMMIRLLGEEKIALSKDYAHPFNDVPEWADRYIGYMYQNNLTKGISQNQFGSSLPITERDYITFVLRALGYSDTKGDFLWSQAIEFSESIGLHSRGDRVFTRGTMVDISYKALHLKLKGTDKTLLDKLESSLKGITANDSNEDCIYFINFTSDSDFYSKSDSYRIFKKKKDGSIEQVSKNQAYRIAIVGDTIYYIKIDGLERGDGFVQRGVLWKVNTDGTGEEQVLDGSVFSLASDGTYLYISGEYPGYENSIIKMNPSNKKIETFIDTKSYNLTYSEGYLYYEDPEDEDRIKRVNISTMKVESVTQYPADYYSGFLFIVYKDYLIINGSYLETLLINMKTGEEHVIKENKTYLHVSSDGLLVIRDWEKDTLEFIPIDKII